MAQRNGGLRCKGCDLEINYKANLPRILICCGHTLCQACLTELLATSKRCPNCEKVTKSEDPSGYLVNRALLDLKNSTLDQCRVEFFKKCTEELRQRRLDFERVKPQLQNTLGLLDSRVKEIKEYQDKMVSISRPELIKHKVSYFEQQYTDILHQMTVLPITIRDSDFRSKRYLTPSEYLAEIKSALTSGKYVVALYNFKSLNLEAQVTMKGNRLCIYSFRSESEADGSKVICYRDLQDILLREGMATAVYAFLEIAADESGTNFKTVMIKIYKSTSYLGSHFMKLCTSEIGHYKGLDCTYAENDDVKCIVQVGKPQWNKEELDNYATYFLDKAKFCITCDPGNYYVHMEDDGGFKIFKCKSQSLKQEGVVGLVVDFEGDMEECADSLLHIVESGVAFDI